MPVELHGQLNAAGATFAVVVSRFNDLITRRLLEGAIDTIVRHGGSEIPLATSALARTGKYSAVICLGAVIQGSTSHHEYINSQVAAGIMSATRETGIPVTFGVITCESMDQALDRYEGPVWASHHNCRTLVDWDRQISDRHLQRLIERDAVIGVAFDAVMLAPGWVRGVSQPEILSIESAADHVDHVVQLAGTTRHCAIGTDLDGGYGWEQTPRELRSIFDVHRLEAIFERRGYRSADIDGIFWGNWLRKLREALPVRR